MNNIPTDSSHSYFRCLSYHSDPLPWRIHDSSSGHPDYLQGVLQSLEEHLDVEGLTFYVTWKLDELPSYGSDVVAIVMGDEWCQVPSYAHRVLTTFKQYGVRPQLRASPRLSHINALLFAKYLRMYLHYMPRAIWHKTQILKQRAEGKCPPQIYAIPLGYGNQVSLPIKPIEERPNDVFFAGSVEQGGSAPAWHLRQWIRSPKNVSRERMLDSLHRLAGTLPSLNLRIHTNARFVLNALEYGLLEPGEALDAQEYSEALMNAKICLVPRGTSPETFRFFEGLRSGCVLITERLPSRWFYDDAPVIQIDDWTELDDVIPSLLSNPDRMQRLHKASLEWWRSTCSEEAVGVFMAERIHEAL